MRIFNNDIIKGSNICMYNNKVIINGKTYKVPKGNISITDGTIYVDGKKFDTSDSDLIPGSNQIVNIIIKGDCHDINCNGSIEVNGSITGYVDCGGSITIDGNVCGNIDCGGSVTIHGIHDGDIDAGGSVSIMR